MQIYRGSFLIFGAILGISGANSPEPPCIFFTEMYSVM